ncbi:uncharacterized protein LOC110861310 [Folsomia candida]|uniref:uncharacterized protein LOC110861310 n=1 Tax=Folsomia candida TaxID=158441 RepID=UPI000B8F6D2C|nr:uncharacterized protein LOC110861310 [Folsomia candida]
MDRPRRARGPLRRVFTTLVNEMKEELAKEDPDEEVLEVQLNRLEGYAEKMTHFDNVTMDALLDSNATEEELNEETLSCEEYNKKLVTMRYALRRFLSKKDRSASPSSANVRSLESTSTRDKKTYRLPKLELKKFGGDLIEWLSWWSQFEKIHLDEDLETSDKFQYLAQSMMVGSRAKELIDSYPMTAANYHKAVQALKERFGRDHLLVEVYVRELLKMVISNVCSKDKCDIMKMYDKLESHLRALDSLGVTTDKCAAMLFPIVESSLPEELLRVWQRSEIPSRADAGTTSLTSLMEFLRQEVRNEERISLARSGFGMTKDKKIRSREDGGGDNYATSAGLFSGQKTECAFCKKPHPTQDCFRAKTLSYDVKRQKLQEMKCCFSCLKVGHNANKCRNPMRCQVCQEKHPTVMCPGLSIPRTRPESLFESFGRERVVRLIYDSGNQQSFVRRDTMKSLGVNKIGEEWVNNCLFGGMVTGPIKHNKYRIQIESLNGHHRESLEVLDRDDICGLIARVPSGPWIKELANQGVHLTDFTSDSPEIEILIGSDYYGKLMTGRVVQLKSGLTAFQSTFGWSLGGKVPKDNIGMTVTSLFLASMDESKLWDLDVIGITDPAEHLNKEDRDKEVKEHFLQSVCREDGRYCVSLPWMDGRPNIPCNKNIAERRLVSATEKIIQSGYYDKYDEVFESWRKEGIIEEIEDDDEVFSHYLPHRAVIKPESITTPIRPVFDASCKTRRTPSLNESLEKGPNLLEQIPDMLLRFRRGQIGVTSDIRKAFLQIKVTPEDTNYLRFLWWEDWSKKKLKIFRHLRVVFGVNCSPYLLGAVIEHHLKSVKTVEKDVAEQLWKSPYVDNCVSTVSSESELEHFKSAATKIMEDAKMDLRMWEWSHQDNSITSVLGMKWNKADDTLGYQVEECAQQQFTKREVLSCAQKFIDPLGYLCPALIVPKIILQEAWRNKISWDENLDENLITKFTVWISEVPSFQEIWIKRNAFGDGRGTMQIHTFVDASKSSYAAAVFLRVDNDGEVDLHLLQARVHHRSKIDKGGEESLTALAWIRRDDIWGKFVGNRVREILTLSKEEEWRHIPGTLNPADLPSRGCSPAQLRDSRWWEGPHWLKLDEESWPIEKFTTNEEEVMSEKLKSVTVNLLTSCADVPWYCKKFSSFNKIVNLVAWILRFVEKTRKRSNSNGPLTVAELEHSEKKLLSLVQSESFKRGEKTIANLRVVWDTDDGIARVQTKLLMRTDMVNFKTPILLPEKHPLVRLLIRYIHLESGHGGTQYVMGRLREKYWIIRGRKAVRQVITGCVRCRRFSAQHVKTPEAPLPEDRVRTSVAFEVVGVDLAGPLFLKGGTKIWTVLFTCAVYRCVHLELVKSLSTEAFLMAFHRFIDRRGTPAVVSSDNGRNFVGAVNLFSSINWDEIEEKSREKRIVWKFNPPTAAWWGGWWEKLIGLMKGLLKRMLGQARVNHEELMTCIIQVENVLNNRPLTVVTEDPQDLKALTPSMFLLENKNGVSPEMEQVSMEGLNKRLKFLRKIREELRSRFRKEYLALLVQPGSEKTSDLKIGDVVLVGSDGVKRQDWPMAKVVDLIPGRDGYSRTARVKTSYGELLRPVQRLYPMEIILIAK